MAKQKGLVSKMCKYPASSSKYLICIFKYAHITNRTKCTVLLAVVAAAQLMLLFSLFK